MATRKRRTTKKAGKTATKKAAGTTAPATKLRVAPTATIAKRLRTLLDLMKRLPGVDSLDTVGLSTFRVRRKVFAYYLNNHHQDGIVAVAMKAAPDQNKQLAALAASAFYLPAHIGVRGWVAMRMDLTAFDADQLEALIVASYRATAPPKLVAEMSVALSASR